MPNPLNNGKNQTMSSQKALEKRLQEQIFEYSRPVSEQHHVVEEPGSEIQRRSVDANPQNSRCDAQEDRQKPPEKATRKIAADHPPVQSVLWELQHGRQAKQTYPPRKWRPRA